MQAPRAVDLALHTSTLAATNAPHARSAGPRELHHLDREARELWADRPSTSTCHCSLVILCLPSAPAINEVDPSVRPESLTLSLLLQLPSICLLALESLFFICLLSPPPHTLSSYPFDLPSDAHHSSLITNCAEPTDL